LDGFSEVDIGFLAHILMLILFETEDSDQIVPAFSKHGPTKIYLTVPYLGSDNLMAGFGGIFSF